MTTQQIPDAVALRRELDETRARLAEATETLAAIRSGEVDGLVTSGPEGRKMFTLQGAQEPYRLLIEQMSEGALTLSDNGFILYANQTFAHLLRTPLERVIGMDFRTFVVPADRPGLADLIEAARRGSSRGEMSFRVADGSFIPMRLGLSRLQLDPETLVSVVATDLTETRKKEAELQRARAGLEKRVEERTSDLAVSRLAALNMMEEAVEAHKAIEASNRQLVAETAERERIMEELRSAHAQLAHLFEHSPVITYHQRIEAGAILALHASGNFTRLLGYTNAEAKSMAWWQAHLHPDDRERALASISELMTQGTSRTEYRIRHQDGRYLWMDDTRRLVRDAEGNPAEIFGAWIDITERKQADAALQAAQRELIDVSRHAGMAEVATSVLHNVGNVLNSVNVSATLVIDRMRTSKLQRLEKIAGLLRAQNGAAAEFIAHDPKGRMIPGYLVQLGDEIGAERGVIVEELSHLRENVDHIKEIVAMQQSYAKLSGAPEKLSLSEVVEDALRMNAGAAIRHGVEVVRDFPPGPTITIERHKILQILVNLLRNAKYACDDSGRTEKRITVRIVHDGAQVKVMVADNGIGIPAENLTRIFTHGFTTRKDGHGFGLHSGANAAQSLGGSLRAESAGPGCGATFTLTLPLEPAGRG